MNKAELRETLKAQRDGFAASAPRFLAPDTPVPEPLRALLSLARCVSAYVPIGSEADPLPLLAQAQQSGCETALPHVTRRTAPMRFLRWQPGDALIGGAMGLSQPDAAATEVSPDLVIVPLLGFDRRLHRIGYGAGFYDRALAALPAAKRIGLAWSAQEVDALPIDDWDVPLDAIWTEREWIGIGE